MTTTVDRRKFMAAVGGTAATAAAAGVAGELLLKKRLPVNPPVAAASPQAAAASPQAKVTPPHIVKQKPLPAEDSLDIPGLSPYLSLIHI